MRCTEFEACEPTFRSEAQVSTDEFQEVSANGISFDVTLSYPRPLITRLDAITIVFELVEKKDPRISYPITITSVRALDGPILFGQNLDSHAFNAIDDRVEITVPIDEPGQPEELHDLRLRLRLEYQYLDEKQVIEDGSLVYDQYGRPVMQTVQDNVVRSNLVLNLMEAITIIDLKAVGVQ
jgi:hypothetical protein